MSIVLSSLHYLKTLGFLSGVSALGNFGSSYRLASRLDTIRNYLPLDLFQFLKDVQSEINSLLLVSKYLDDDDHTIKLTDNLKGNFIVWTLFDLIRKRSVPLDDDTGSSKYVNRSYTLAKEISSVRSAGNVVNHLNNESLTEGSHLSSINTFLDYNKWCEVLYNLESRSNKSFERSINILKKNNSFKLGWTGTQKVQAISLWGNIFIKVLDKGSKFGPIFFLTTAHYRRLTDLFRSSANFSISVSMLKTSYTSYQAFETILKMLIRLSKRDPDSVGEWVKSARNILVCELDHDEFMDEKMASLMMKEYDEEKTSRCLEILDTIKDMCPSKEERLMISNLYKIIPHPDLDMRQAFEKIKGLMSPNKVNQNGLNLFRGTLRKSIYLSLKEQGHDVRSLTVGADPSIEKMINETQVIMSTLKETPPIRWSSIQFSRVWTLPDLLNLSIPTSDKSSATSKLVSVSQAEELKIRSKNVLNEGVKSKIKKDNINLRPLNDIITELNDRSELDPHVAWERFKKVRSLNILFERLYPDKQIEDIPHEDFENFIKDNLEIAYNVQTEPKLGEKHKKVTRMFYMAEQMLKTLTQRVERISKNISKKQSGVSIVKDYSARRKDLEIFASSMKSSPKNMKNIYISFDLNSFSMKFPMELIREYGKLLSELTGYKELDRIDLFFRFTKVMHSTRGFFDIMYGPLGGFEGFLNFVWSSIHATIMEIALGDVGKTGYLLTYSDDGLLQIQIPESMSKRSIVTMIGRIKQTYDSYGLSFNIGKTIISGTVWEYLGDICYQGHLIPQWIKEVTSLCIKENSEGFNPLIMNQEQVIGQCSSLAYKGFPAYVSEFLALFYNGMELMRIYPKVPDSVIRLALILPRNMGGFRVPPACKMSTSSNIPDISEVSADLYLYSKFSPQLVSQINYLIDSYPPNSSSSFETLLTGNYFKLDVPSTDSKGIIHSLVERIIDKAELSINPNPLTPERIKSMSELFKRVQNLDPNILFEFVSSLPDIKIYNDLSALAHTKTAYKILGKDTLRKAQFRDRRNCLNAIDRIYKAVSMSKDYNSDPSYMKKIALGSYLKNYSIFPPRLSPRLFLVKVDNLDNADYTVITTLDSPVKASLNQLHYLEPTALKKSQKSILSWSAELNISKKESYMKRFLQVMSAIATHHYEAYSIFELSSNLFGIIVPTVPTNTATSIQRYKSFLSSRPDITIGSPTCLISRSTVKVSRRLSELYTTYKSSDKTTYYYYSMWLANQELLSKEYYRIMSQPEPIVFYYRYNDTAGELLTHITPNPMFRDKKRLPLLNYPRNSIAFDKDISEMYVSSIEDKLKNEVFISSVSSGISNFDNETNYTFKLIISEVIVSDLSKMIFRLVTTPTKSGIMRPSILPLSLATYTTEIKHAYIRAFYKFAKRYPDGQKEFTELLVDNKLNYSRVLRNYLNIFITISKERLNHLPVEVYSEYMMQVSLNNIRMVKEVLEVETRSVFDTSPGIKKKLILFERDNFGMDLTSEGRVKLINDQINNVISELYTFCKEANWDSKAINDKSYSIRVKDRVDWLLDMLILAKKVIRKSAHRPPDKPYNIITFVIEYCKYISLVRRALESKKKFKLTEFNDIYKDHVIEKNFALAIINKYSLKESDTDHLNKLSAPVLKPMLTRAYYAVLAHSDNYKVDQKFKYEKQYSVLLSNFTYSLCLQTAENDQSSFYTIIISKVNRAIKVYSTFAHSSLYGELPLFKSSTYNSVYINYEDSNFKIKFQNTPTEDATIILYGQISMELYEKGLDLLDLPDNMPKKVHILSALNGLSKQPQNKSKKGQKVRFNELKHEPGTLSAFSLILSNEFSAKLLIACLYSKGITNCLCYKDIKGYYVSFVTLKKLDEEAPFIILKESKRLSNNDRPTVLTNKGSPAVTNDISKIDIDIDISVIKTVYLLAYNQKDQSYNSENQAKDISIYPYSPDETSDQKLVGSNVTYEGNIPVEILAAATCTSGATDSSSLYIAYLLIMSYIHGVGYEKVDLLDASLNKLISESNQIVKMAITDDIRTCITWLKLINVNVPSEMSEEVANIFMKVFSIKSSLQIQDTVILPGEPISLQRLIGLKGACVNNTISQNSIEWFLRQYLFVEVRLSNFYSISSKQYAIITNNTVEVKGLMSYKEEKEENGDEGEQESWSDHEELEEESYEESINSGKEEESD